MNIKTKVDLKFSGIILNMNSYCLKNYYLSYNIFAKV